MDFMYTQSKNILFDGFFGLVVVRHEGFVDLSPWFIFGIACDYFDGIEVHQIFALSTYSVYFVYI
jgi:hypothetical protein